MISSVTSEFEITCVPIRFLSNSITRGSNMHCTTIVEYVKSSSKCHRGTKVRTMGARIISSYARSPYFSASLFGLRTTKSYRLSATSPCILNDSDIITSAVVIIGSLPQPKCTTLLLDLPLRPNRTTLQDLSLYMGRRCVPITHGKIQLYRLRPCSGTFCWFVNFTRLVRNMKAF